MSAREQEPAKAVSEDGTPIAIWRTGAGPPLVLVHGAAADHSRWAPVLPALEDRFTVLAIDRRGRGQSGDGDEYASEREYEHVAAVVESAGEEVCVLGHSYDRFRELDVPTLFLEGGDSPAAFQAAGEAVREELPNCRVVVMPGQRHAAMDTGTELFGGGAGLSGGGLEAEAPVPRLLPREARCSLPREGPWYGFGTACCVRCSRSLAAAQRPARRPSGKDKRPPGAGAQPRQPGTERRRGADGAASGIAFSMLSSIILNMAYSTTKARRNGRR